MSSTGAGYNRAHQQVDLCEVFLSFDPDRWLSHKGLGGGTLAQGAGERGAQAFARHGQHIGHTRFAAGVLQVHAGAPIQIQNIAGSRHQCCSGCNLGQQRLLNDLAQRYFAWKCRFAPSARQCRIQGRKGGGKPAGLSARAATQYVAALKKLGLAVQSVKQIGKFAHALGAAQKQLALRVERIVK